MLGLLLCAQTSQAQFFTDTSAQAATKRVWVASLLLPGSGQVINRQYWKVPIVYASAGTFIYFGIKANKNFNAYYDDYSHFNPTYDPLKLKEAYKIRYAEQRNTRNLCFAAAGVVYIASVLDAVVVKNQGRQSAATASILSAVLPGAGQAYNKKFWKIPVIYGGIAGLYYGMAWNNKMYNRYKTALLYRTDKSEKTVPPEWAKNRDDANLTYYMDNHHSNRDLCVLGLVLLYAANIIDANVDAVLYDWNVDDDLSFRVKPAIINVDPQSPINSGLGLALTVSF